MGKSAKKKKGGRGAGFLIGVGVCVCVVAITVASAYLIMQYLEYKMGSDAYSGLAQRAGAQGRARSDGIEPPGGWPKIDFQALSAENADVVAWIYMPESQISYPVVHGSDNDYYLRRLFDGQSNSAGTLFVDARNSKSFSDVNTVIYGHNMKNGTMFHALTLYKDQSYYDTHPRMYLMTMGGNYVLDLFAGFVTSTRDDSWERTFSGADSYIAWMERMRDKSTFKSGVELDAQYRCVTLSTCSYEYNDARYVVIGKLVRAD